jgi:hypothetical protein
MPLRWSTVTCAPPTLEMRIICSVIVIAFMNDDGVETDTAKAVEVYRRSADSGCLYAMQSLGNCYFSVDEMEKNAGKQLSCTVALPTLVLLMPSSVWRWLFRRGWGVD